MKSLRQLHQQYLQVLKQFQPAPPQPPLVVPGNSSPPKLNGGFIQGPILPSPGDPLATVARIPIQAPFGLAGELMPDRMAPVIGYRSWYFFEGLGLMSLNQRTRWTPLAELRAECLVNPAHGDNAPVESCSCGIYALNGPGEGLYGSVGFLPGPYPVSRKQAMVVGRVAMWGRVCVGTKGYRAQFAYPSVLYVPDQLQATIKAAYGIPVLGAEDWADVVRRAA